MQARNNNNHEIAKINAIIATMPERKRGPVMWDAKKLKRLQVLLGEGYTRKEIAKRMKCSAMTVRNYIERARKVQE